MNWVVLIISLFTLSIGIFLNPRKIVKSIKVKCTKVIDSASKPLLKPCETGEQCEYGEESDHDVHECENLGYMYTINGVDYSRDGKIIESKTLQDSPSVMTKEIKVDENDYMYNKIIATMGGSGIIISFFI